MSEGNEELSIRILGMNFGVEESDHVAMTGLDGLVHFGSRRILVRPGITFPMQRSTILHEILEALNGMMELKLEHNQISSLESGLNQVLSDNADLLKLWMYDEDAEEEGSDVEDLE